MWGALRLGDKGISGTVINKKDNTSPQAPGYSSLGLIFSFERALALEATRTQTPFPEVFIRRRSGPTTNSRSAGAGRGRQGEPFPRRLAFGEHTSRGPVPCVPTPATLRAGAQKFNVAMSASNHCNYPTAMLRASECRADLLGELMATAP